MDELLVDAAEARRMLRIGRDKLNRLVRERKVPVVRIGGLIRFSPEALRQWVRDQEQLHRPNNPEQDSREIEVART